MPFQANTRRVTRLARARRIGCLRAMEIPAFSPAIDRLPGSTPFVPPEALQRQSGVPITLRLGANESLFGASPAAVASLCETAAKVWMYPDAEAHDLRAALAAHYHTEPGRVLIGAGIDGLLDSFVRLFAAPGSAVVTTQGGYPTFAYHARAAGAEIIALPYARAHVPLDALAEQAHRRAARLVYLSNPDNPTGSWHDAPAIRSFAEALPKNCALLLDEAYGELAPPGSADADLSDLPHVIRLRTFSKAYGLAGLRVGYALAHPELLAGAHRVRNHFGTGRPAIAAAQAALGDGDWLTKSLARTAESRRAVAAALAEAGLSPLPSATNFVTAETGRGRAYAEALLGDLLTRGVFIRKPAAPPLDGCIRATLPPVGMVPQFAEALEASLRRLG